MKIYVTAIVKSKATHRTEVWAVLQNMVTQTHQEKACEIYTLHQSIEDENTFVFYEIWENQEGLDFHNSQTYVKEFIALMEEKLENKPIILKTKLV